MAFWLILLDRRSFLDYCRVGLHIILDFKSPYFHEKYGTLPVRMVEAINVSEYQIAEAYSINPIYSSLCLRYSKARSVIKAYDAAQRGQLSICRTWCSTKVTLPQGMLLYPMPFSIIF